MKSFDSLVYSMMQKVLDKGVPLNIYLPHGQAMVRDEEVKGEVFSVQWWPTEGNLNIQYQFRDEGGNLRTRDYRVRPLSGKLFDDTYTLKKVDGVLTLVRRPREEPVEEAKKPKAPAEELNMAGQLAMRTIQKWHEEDRPVHLDINAHGGVMVRGPLLNISPVDDGYTLQVQLPEGWTSSGWVGPNRINRFKLTVGTSPNGVKQLQVTMREKELDEELDDTTEPLLLSMLRKVMATRAVVKYVTPGAERSFNHIRPISDADGRLKSVVFMRYPIGVSGPATKIVEKSVSDLQHFMLKQQVEKTDDGRSIWHMFDRRKTRVHDEAD